MRRTIVCVTDNGLAKGDFNLWQTSVVTETHPAVREYPDAFRVIGTVDDDGLAYMRMLGPRSTLERVMHLIIPLSEDDDARHATVGAVANDPEAHGLLRSRVLVAAKRAHDRGGHNSESIHGRLLTSRATLMRPTRTGIGALARRLRHVIQA